MIISLNKKVPGQKRHVILLCDADEINKVAPVVAEVIKGYKPERDFIAATGKWKYRFSTKFLDDLLLAFPLATKSPGLQKRMDRLSSAALDEREVDPFEIPGLWDRWKDAPAQPFPHQYIAIAECVRFINGEMDESEVESFLENDEMGLGKTLITLCTILMLCSMWGRQLKVLVVTPYNGKKVWERENSRWAGFDLQLIESTTQTPAERRKLIGRRADLTVINPEMLRGERLYDRSKREHRFTPKYPELFDFEYDLVVFDEYHRFGSPKSQQTTGMLELSAKRFLPMSGTPYLNRPEQLWPILHRCWPGRYPDFDQFVRAIQIVDKPTGKVVGYHPKFTRPLKMFIDERSIRRRKDQVLEGLPEALPIDLPVQLNREQRRIYNKIRDEAMLVLESGDEVNIAFQSTVVMRLKQACFSPELFGGSKHSAKIDELRAYVESLVDSNEKALIFSEWSKATRILQRELKDFNPAYVDGSVTGNKRMAQADLFNNNPDCHLYIGTIGANREAVSLGAATTVIFTDLDPSPQVNAQAAGRSAAGGIRGLGSKVPHVGIVTMWGEDTYEERVLEDIAFKAGHFNAIVERDGGRRVTKKKITSLRDLM